MNAIALLLKLLPLLEMILKDAPELVKDVEQLISDIKSGGNKTTSASEEAHADMDGLEAKLEAPAK